MLTAVLGKDGNPLMPTYNIKKIRKLLKSKRAVIVCHEPFAVRLLYTTKENNKQEVELSMDTGYVNIGISIKSEKHEFVSEERKLLTDEKDKHQDQRRFRRTRRNRLRYRRPDNKRASSSKHKQEGWLAPSLKNKADRHVELVKHYMKYFPITGCTLEMGQFDTQILTAINEGKPLPEGIDYQHGPSYGFDTLREAVFSRDKHICQVCKKSAVKDKVILVLHHIGYRKKDRSNRMGNLLTVCSKCHCPKNHQECGKLWDLEPESDTIRSAAFMNTVKWYIYNEVSKFIDTHITYGAVTKRTRLDRNILKSHANDAYCIGKFYPKHRNQTRYFKKRRRNDRCLEVFYDARYIDTRDGQIKAGIELGCNRTKRNVPRNNPDNLRKYHGRKIKKGYRRIRKQRYPFKSGQKVIYENKAYVCGGQRNNGTSVVIKNYYPDGKEKSVSPKKVKQHTFVSGWTLVAKKCFEK